MILINPSKQMVFLDVTILIKQIFFITFFFYCLSYPFAKDDPFQEFLTITTPMGKTQRNTYYEMGLNSDNEFIFLHSIKSLLLNRHYSALKLIEQLSTQKQHSKQKIIVLNTYYHKLKYFSLPEEQRVAYLEKRINNDNPSQYTELFNWAIIEFGDIATLKHEHALLRLKKYPIFHEDLLLTNLKLKINSQNYDRVERYISATQSTNQKIRYWGLAHLVKIKDKRVAKYLTLLLDQNNLHSGHLEFANIEETLQEHKLKFPELYKGSFETIGK